MPVALSIWRAVSLLSSLQSNSLAIFSLPLLLLDEATDAEIGCEA